MSVFEQFQARYDATQEEEFSLQEYLEICKQDSSAYATAAERLLIAIGAIILWSESASTARLYPVMVNLGMLAYFGSSLLHPPSAIERIARISEPDLPPQAIIYTARVTMVWCLFFVINGAIALYTAIWSSLEIWTLYNGLIAYLAMGLLFSVEYLIRRHVREATDG